jgi:ubiquinone/menaquinone biosynthesis C-methylase UbiE
VKKVLQRTKGSKVASPAPLVATTRSIVHLPDIGQLPDGARLESTEAAVSSTSFAERKTAGLVKGGLSLTNYHKIMNDLYEEVLGEHFMVHFPYYGARNDTLIDCQINLTEACLRRFPELKGKRVLEVGCGNGVQAIYTLIHYGPDWVTGLDFNGDNVRLGTRIAAEKGLSNIDFVEADAQSMDAIPDASYDCILNVESAFHYPDKNAFFREMNRVLKPGGTFVIADILMKPNRRNVLLRWWERRMSQNYWPLDRYKRRLAAAGLVVTEEEDITEPVLRGFATHRRWFRQYKFRGLIRRLLIMTFAKLQVFRHVHYLRKINTYNIFVGHRPAE